MSNQNISGDVSNAIETLSSNKVPPLPSKTMVSYVYGAYSSFGGRETQQDDYLITTFGSNNIPLFAVFDGHGSEGHKASALAKKLFPEFLKPLESKLHTDPISALKEAYASVHEEMCSNQTLDAYLSGTTSVLALLVGNKLIVSHVGDSRLVLVREKSNGETIAKQITLDHTCKSETEKSRVQGTGARIEQLWNGNALEGPLRIFKGSLPYPGIVVTRSLGDAVASKLGVLSEPEVSILDLTEEDKAVIIATDGLWDSLSNEEAVKIISSENDVSKAAQLATEQAVKQVPSDEPADNTTTIVVRFTF